jgi:dTDP-4-dehydrorhamnose 3,5-epimerase
LKFENIAGSKDLILYKPLIFKDSRGSFVEKFSTKIFQESTGKNIEFIQVNESFSCLNVLRGLHYQLSKPQGKLVTVISGRVLDVAVDLRTFSSTYGQAFCVELNSTSKHSLWIPRGYAHGFLSLSEEVIFSYMVDNIYDPPSEHTLLWSDSFLEINWQTSNPSISKKDSEGKLFEDTPKFNLPLYS